jgi:hypothetical protein
MSWFVLTEQLNLQPFVSLELDMISSFTSVLVLCTSVKVGGGGQSTPGRGETRSEMASTPTSMTRTILEM